jgi:hypothetical protein
MRMIFCLLTAEKAQFVLVEGGKLDQFAEVKVPEHYGLGELAALGSNLADSLNLNGDSILSQPRPRPQAPDRGRAKGGGRPRTTGSSGPPRIAERFISVEEIRAVINRHPEGVTAREIASEIAGHDNPPKWLLVAVNNRDLTSKVQTDRGETPPWRTETRPHIGKKGQPTKLEDKYYLPMPSYL